MPFNHCLLSGLVLAILMVAVSCQNAILSPNNESIVVKGQLFMINWRLISINTDYSNVSISLINPDINLASTGLDVITYPFAVAKAGREIDSGFYLYTYDWVPSEILKTSERYRIRVDDGGVIIDSSEFLITSLNDLNKTTILGSHGPSPAVVGGAVAGAVVGFIAISIIVFIFVAKRRGWSIKKEDGNKESGAEEGSAGTGSDGGVSSGGDYSEARDEEDGIIGDVSVRNSYIRNSLVRSSVISDRSITPLEVHVELEGSPGRNSELPGSVVGEEMPTED